MRHIAAALVAALLLWAGPVRAAAMEQDIEILNPQTEQKIEILTPDADQQVRIVDANGAQQSVTSSETTRAEKVAGDIGKGIFGFMAVVIGVGSALASLLLL